MHELSIALSIVEIAEEELERHGGLQVIAVYLRLGLLSGVMKYPLLSSFEIACEGTSLEGSHLVIEELPGIVFCPACDANRPVRPLQWLCCSECGALGSKIVQGKEIEVVALEVEE